MIVTGYSRGYAFVEYKYDEDFTSAFYTANHIRIDNSQIIVDYMREQTIPGWIPRRLGGGVGGKKQSGQMRFGGRDCPFRVPFNSSLFSKQNTRITSGNREGDNYQKRRDDYQRNDYRRDERRDERRDYQRNGRRDYNNQTYTHDTSQNRESYRESRHDQRHTHHSRRSSSRRRNEEDELSNHHTHHRERSRSYLDYNTHSHHNSIVYFK